MGQRLMAARAGPKAAESNSPRSTSRRAALELKKEMEKPELSLKHLQKDLHKRQLQRDLSLKQSRVTGSVDAKAGAAFRESRQKPLQPALKGVK